MRATSTVWRATLGLLLCACGVTGQTTGTSQEDTYLGQRVPGTIPEVFAPGLISTSANDAGAAVHPDLNEICFCRVRVDNGVASSTIHVTRWRDGSWTSPEVAPFSGTYNDCFVAFHPDGSRLYYQSDRPIDPLESAFEWNIWYVERVGDGWSEPRSMGRPINGRNHTGGPSVTRDGTMYFTIMELGGPQRIYRSRLADGSYQEPEELPATVNARVQQFDSYVAPDESYLIFGAIEGSGGHANPGGLYICFRDSVGAWGVARLMGPDFNSNEPGTATISPEGRYVFFTRDNSANGTGRDVFWVDARALDAMR